MYVYCVIWSLRHSASRAQVVYVRLQRFGPPDQEYYYKKSDDAQPDDLETSKWTESAEIKGNALLLLLRLSSNGNRGDGAAPVSAPIF